MNGEQCAIARTPDDLSRLKTEGKKAFYIGIENGYGIGKDLKNIIISAAGKIFARRGFFCGQVSAIIRAV